MYPKNFILVLLFTSVSLFSIAQKSLDAVKVTQALKIDGKLDEAVWQQATVATDFIVNSPSYGALPMQKTEVRIVYDNDAIYIGAYLKDDPSLIRRQLTSRDNEQFKDVDNFHVAFDTYNDNQNAFQFIVTSANVQSDVRISSSGSDYSWDGIWDSKTSIQPDGWIAEIKIPYMALRFSKKEIQDWGINFSRFTRRFNEQSYWNPVDPKIDGYVNQFGDLKGLQNLDPPLRLSFLPYVSFGYRHIPTSAGPQKDILKNGGMDVKYGINESFTLDMTLIPDFGQVLSDNVILNLSPFEQQFNENRPFFTEGTELFKKAGIFYSRRVGSLPSKYYDAISMAIDSGYTILKNPSITQLYNATKFSGRTKKNVGIGIFNAVTAPMYAELQDKDGKVFDIETEPLANYNIIVLDQILKNRSSISFTNTNVIRNGVGRDANVTAIDLSFFNRKNTYNWQMSGRYSHVTGIDSHDGFKSTVGFGKVSGKWQWSINNNIESDKYDPNDLGILQSPNEFTTSAGVSYIQFTPNKHFNFRRYNISLSHRNLYKPFAFQEFNYNSNFFHLFKNFWDVNFVAEGSPVWYNDYFELRTSNRKLKRAPWRFFGLFGSTDSRKKLFVSYGLGMAESPIPADPFYLTELGIRYRFGPKFSLEINGRREHDLGNFGWVFFDSTTAEPVIGRRQIKQFNTVLSGVYNFKPRMNLSLRARHYWSKVYYQSFFDVQTDGYWTDRSFASGYDRNFNVFNIDMFFTWDFLLGSRLIIAWKNALGPETYIDGLANNKYTQNFTKIFTVPHSNELSVKVVYFVDYNQLRKKTKV